MDGIQRTKETGFTDDCQVGLRNWKPHVVLRASERAKTFDATGANELDLRIY